MNWIKPLTLVEHIFIAIFLVVYFAYFIRLYFVAKRLGTTARSVIIKFIIRSLYLSLCIVGLLGPSFGVSEIETQAAGRDVFLVFDLSKSMDAIDVEPTRLEKVKFELNKNLDLLASDRIGIVVFSSEAFTHTPLTFDRSAVKIFIQKLNTNVFRQNGTNLNAAFELIAKKFQHSNAPNNRKAKVIVLITDGEDFGKIDNSLIFQLKKNQINLFTLGVGTANGGGIRIGNGFKKDKKGVEVVTRLNAAYLQSLTDQLNGKYYELNNEVNDLPKLLKDVENVEGNWVDLRKMTVENNKYYYYLILALILMIVDILFTVRTIKI